MNGFEITIKSTANEPNFFLKKFHDSCIVKMQKSEENSPILSVEAPPKPTTNESVRRVEELYDIPVGATTTDLPPGVLYKVSSPSFASECDGGRV